jgi:hypothetical protein
VFNFQVRSGPNGVTSAVSISIVHTSTSDYGFDLVLALKVYYDKLYVSLPVASPPILRAVSLVPTIMTALKPGDSFPDGVVFS